MKTRDNPELYHDLSGAMLAVGYRSDIIGLCKGVALAGVKEFLNNKLNRFNRCLRLFFSTEKVNDSDMIDILAQLDSIELFNQPYYHRELFHRPLSSKNVEEVSSVLCADAKHADAIKKVGDWRKIYNLGEFELLCNVLNKSAIHFAKKNNMNFAMTLDSFSHMIGLCYDHVENVWVVIDSLQLPTKKIHPRQLKTELGRIFQTKNNLIGLEISLFSCAKYAAIAGKLMEELRSDEDFERLHSITYKDAVCQTAAGLTLAHFAASSGNCHELKQLAALNKKSLSQASAKGFTPAFLAAQHGELDVLKFLDAENIPFTNTMTQDGWTLAHVAAERDQLEVLKWLATKKNDSLNKEDGAGWTPLHIASKEGYLDAAQFLVLEHKVPIAQKTFLGSAPIAIASKYRHHELIRFFKTEELKDQTQNFRVGLEPFKLK